MCQEVLLGPQLSSEQPGELQFEAKTNLRIASETSEWHTRMPTVLVTIRVVTVRGYNKLERIASERCDGIRECQLF